MGKNTTIKCPICEGGKAVNLFNLNCGNVDNSKLYQRVKVAQCEDCGHIYNVLLPSEINGLMEYYDEEYALSNIGMKSIDKVGDRPGSDNPNTRNRYDQLYKLIKEYINPNHKILDAGCATGGFLNYLSQRGFNNLYGFDVSQGYVQYAQKNNKHVIKLGNIESIPFDNQSMNIIVADQVLEHVDKIKQALKETKRVLADGGLLCISVPDASRYNQKYFFDFYWFLLREHIQHFDIRHLELLADQSDFELMNYSQYELPMMSDKMILPVLSVVFRLTNRKKKITASDDFFALGRQIVSYETENLETINKKIEKIDLLARSRKPVYVWGMSREFFYLYKSAGLKYCNIVGLIDDNPYKQKAFLVDGRRVNGRSILEEVTADSVLIISAVAHSEKITKELESLNYRGEIINYGV